MEMKQVNKLITDRNWRFILQWAVKLNDDDRYQALNYLQQLDIDALMDMERPKDYSRNYYDKRKLISYAHDYARVTCIRSKKDLQLTPSIWDNDWSVVHSYLIDPGYPPEAIVRYFNLYPPDYLTDILTRWKNERQYAVNFHLLWTFYKKGWVDFEEEYFVRSLFIIPMGYRSVRKDVDFLEGNLEIIDRVLLKFYKYEISVLDISKWSNYSGKSVCEKCTRYWDEVFDLLLKRRLITDRSIVIRLFETLNYNWKKGHIDWHIRLIKRFGPTLDEYLENQQTLYAALYSTNNTVSNFIIPAVNKIYQDKRFDTEAFLQNVCPLFTRQKSDIAILTVLNIIEWIVENRPALTGIVSMVADALVQPTEKIQVRAAELLKKYLGEDDAARLAEPFASTLKEKARSVLQLEEICEEEIDADLLLLEHNLLSVPDNWEDLLFHLGQTTKTLDPADIDLFFHGLLLLQNKLPDNYQDQLKPYIKLLSKVTKEEFIIKYLYEFLDNWLNTYSAYQPNAWFARNDLNPMPFFRNRNMWIIDRLKRNSQLPLLHFPTHTPFYIDPDVLISRLAAYDQADEPVITEDLIIACNRILSFELSAESRKKLSNLKGKHLQPLLYLFGLTDKIEPDEAYLPLWTQVARTRYPEGTFNEFLNTTAREYPTVVHPFIVDCEIVRRYSDDKKYHWDMLLLEQNWSESNWGEKINNIYPPLYYYTGYNRTENDKDCNHSDETRIYEISLAPRYPDALLAMLSPDYSDGYNGSALIQFLIENQIRIYHSGWIFMAACLIARHKTTRLLAAEYVNRMVELNYINQEYIAGYIATMINGKYAPVNRLMEYMDSPASAKVKQMKQLILKRIVDKADPDKLPINYNKITEAIK